MGRQVKKAITEIEHCIDTLNKSKGNEDIWLNSTIGIIQLYFGADSREFDYINCYSFDKGQEYRKSEFWNTIDRNKNYDERDRHQLIVVFLNHCIDLLKSRKKVYEKPKTNFLSEYTNFKIIGYLVGFTTGIVVPILYLLNTFNNTEKIKLEQKIENIYDSLELSKKLLPTVFVPSTIKSDHKIQSRPQPDTNSNTN